MRKFSQPFDSFELSSEKPLDIELAADKRRFLHLTENPIYYFHAFQYVGGDFYRAVLGYEVLWDKTYEASLMLALDFMLNRWADEGSYYLETIQIEAKAVFYMVPWFRGVKPRSLNLGQTWRFGGYSGRAMARVNLLDKPHHVDIEMPEGKIFSTSYLRYRSLKNRKLVRSLTDEKRNTPRKAKSHASNARGSANSWDQGFSGAYAPQTLANNVFDLRKRLRLSNKMQKASSKVSKHLVR